MKRYAKKWIDSLDLRQFFGDLSMSSVKVDVAEDKDGLTVSAELPGVKEDDLSVTLNDGLLTIQGEKKDEKEEKEENYYMMERSFGSFARTIRLPYDTDADKVDAKFSNGVLKIKIPRPKEIEEKNKTIKIKT